MPIKNLHQKQKHIRVVAVFN